jgi:hypothetical protein
MMQCGPLIIWRPVPDKSTFKPKVTLGDPSDGDAFNITVFVTVGDQAGVPLRHDDIVAGKAKFDLTGNVDVVFDTVLTVFHKLTKPIALDLGIFDSANKPIKVSDGKGGKLDAECTGSFDQSSDPFVIKILALT